MVAYFRATVMLAVLVGLPAAWVYYGPLPPGAQRAVDRVVEVVKDLTGWQHTDEQAPPPIAAPRFELASANAPTFQPQAAMASSPPQASPAAGVQEQVEPLLERLRALGAAEYTLEKWGLEGELFRFRCVIPLAQDKEITRQFEAVAASPLASVEQVVGEVTHWQTARQGQRRFH